MPEAKIGEAVKYVDAKGIAHVALIIHVWEACLNIAYISKSKDNEDSSGNEIIKQTSVPFRQEGMESGYVELC